jgi:hypothetical protein
VERWLKAPMQMPDGTLTARTKGTPQGGPISPLLANLFLHYGFDLWISREYPGVQFERFADDAVIHCVTERQAWEVRNAIGRRFAGIGLSLHPDKTKIVYCKDGRRRRDYPAVSFTLRVIQRDSSVLPRRVEMSDGPLYERMGFTDSISRKRTVACIIPPAYTRRRSWTCAR